MSDRHVLVLYDISDDRRRTRAHAILSQYLTPIQESVFEGRVSPSELKALLDVVQKRIQPTEDHVTVFYPSGDRYVWLPSAARADSRRRRSGCMAVARDLVAIVV